MFLSNTTPLDARLDVAPQPALDVRVGLLVAKATWRWDDRGELALDGQAPRPLLLGDEPSPHGLLPRDDLPRDGEGFEIVVLGSAHAPDGAPIRHRTVAFEVDGARRELSVTGDRWWEGEGDAAVATPPEPFALMPIGWERAYGGSVEVEIDDGTTVPVIDPRNPTGRGLDPSPVIAGLAETLKCPAPYPRWPRRRALPNVEDASRLVTRWSDAPDPAGWGAVATSWGIAEAPFRAAPGCVLDVAPPDGRLVLEGLAPGAPRVLQVPPLVVTTDAAVGTRRTSKALRLARWVVNAEERWITATYRFAFSLQRAKGEPAAMRLRVEGGGDTWG